MTKAFVLDTETTGVESPAMVESALLGVEFFKGLLKPANEEPLVQRWNPGKKIECGAWATHFIEDADVADCPPASEFKLPEGTEYIIGHNIDFDWRVAGEPNVKRICTLALARYLWPHADSHKQLALLYMLWPKRARELASGAHSAGVDVKMCGFLLWAANQQLEAGSFEELWAFSERARIPTVISFGKHKGTAIRDLPVDYVRWLKRQSDMDPYLMKALEML